MSPEKANVVDYDSNCKSEDAVDYVELTVSDMMY